MYVRPDFGVHVKAVAREWSKLQLGALTFTGLCGVLMGGSGYGRRGSLQISSGVAEELSIPVDRVLQATFAPVDSAGSVEFAAGVMSVGIRAVCLCG